MHYVSVAAEFFFSYETVARAAAAGTDYPAPPLRRDAPAVIVRAKNELTMYDRWIVFPRAAFFCRHHVHVARCVCHFLRCCVR